MATTSTEAGRPSKTKSAAGSQSAGKSTGKSAAGRSLNQSSGEIIAERYRDTAYEGLVGRNGESVSAAMSAGEAVFAGMAEVSQEMMAFAGSRLRADIESAEDFAKAGSPEELFEKQCSFAKRAAEHYAEETSKLIAMMARIQQSCWAPMEACTKAALNGLDSAAGDRDKQDGTGGK
jgi:hypothetical protein